MKHLTPTCLRQLMACFLSLTLALIAATSSAESAPPTEDGYGRDETGCSVYKPNKLASDTVRWAGQCVGGFAQGNGMAMWKSSAGTAVTFQGNFVKGQLQGKGVMTASGGDRYMGEYKDGKRHGHGTYYYANGDRFEGEYKNNERNGKGMMLLASGGQIAGEWLNGKQVSGGASASVTPTAPKAAQSPPASAQAGSTKPTNNAIASTASGVRFQSIRCDNWGSTLFGLLPSNVDPSAWPIKSGYNTNVSLPSDFVPIRQAAIEYQKSTCPSPTADRIIIHFFQGRLPPVPPNPHNFNVTGIVAKSDGRRDSMTSWSLTSDAAKARQKMLIQQQQAQARQEEEKAENAARQGRKEYLQKYGATDFDDNLRALDKNPFAFEGKIVAVNARFEQMKTATDAYFELGPSYLPVLATGVPRGEFTGSAYGVLIGKVIGRVDGLTDTLGGSRIHLKYVAFQACLVDRPSICHR